ncbi:MAG: type II secretion system protein [bacterium]|nr:type II secretion system protein [bacterium]
MKKLKVNSLSNKKGFTIIEVVLVLAIAGLIFLAVFVALPALQRTQRDTQRKQDITRLQNALERYRTNNGGKTLWHDIRLSSNGVQEVTSRINLEDFLNSYLKKNEGEFKEPSGGDYNVRVIYWEDKRVNSYAYSQTYPKLGEIIVTAGGGCWDNKDVFRNNKGGTDYRGSRVSTTNSYAIQYYLEVGGVVCVDGN